MSNGDLRAQEFPSPPDEQEVIANFSKILSSEYVAPHGLPYAADTTAVQLSVALGVEFEDLRQRVYTESAVEIAPDRPVTWSEAEAVLRLFGLSPLRSWQERISQGPGTLVALADFYDLDIDEVIKRVQDQTGMLLSPYHPLRPEAVQAITRAMADNMDPAAAVKAAFTRLLGEAEMLRSDMEEVRQRNVSRRAEEAKAKIAFEIANITPNTLLYPYRIPSAQSRRWVPCCTVTGCGSLMMAR